MNNVKWIFTTFSVFLSILFFGVQVNSQTGDPGWPRRITNKTGTLTYYQPQVDTWNSFRDLDFRMAFSLTPTKKQNTVGVVLIHAITDIDVDTRTVYLRNIAIKETHFPSASPEAGAEMGEMLKSFLPGDSVVTIALDRLVALSEKSTDVTTVPVRNEPPMIFISNRPAMLVHVDGEPVKGRSKIPTWNSSVTPIFPSSSTLLGQNSYCSQARSGLPLLMNGEPGNNPNALA